MKKLLIITTIFLAGCTTRSYQKGDVKYHDMTFLNLRVQKGLVVESETKSGVKTGLKVSNVEDSPDNDALKIIVDPISGALKIVK